MPWAGVCPRAAFSRVVLAEMYSRCELTQCWFVSFHPSTIGGSSRQCPEHILLDSKVAPHIKQTVSPHFYYSCGRLSFEGSKDSGM